MNLRVPIGERDRFGGDPQRRRSEPPDWYCGMVRKTSSVQPTKVIFDGTQPPLEEITTPGQYNVRAGVRRQSAPIGKTVGLVTCPKRDWPALGSDAALMPHLNSTTPKSTENSHSRIACTRTVAFYLSGFMRRPARSSTHICSAGTANFEACGRGFYRSCFSFVPKTAASSWGPFSEVWCMKKSGTGGRSPFHCAFGP